MPKKIKRDTNQRIRPNDANVDKKSKKAERECLEVGPPNPRVDSAISPRGGTTSGKVKNKPADLLKILIVDGKMTIQDYSEDHDSEKLIELLKAMGIKPKVVSDGPCG